MHIPFLCLPPLGCVLWFLLRLFPRSRCVSVVFNYCFIADADLGVTGGYSGGRTLRVSNLIRRSHSLLVRCSRNASRGTPQGDTLSYHSHYHNLILSKYPGRPFQLPHADKWVVYITDPGLIKEISTITNHHLSLLEATDDVRLISSTEIGDD